MANRYATRFKSKGTHRGKESSIEEEIKRFAIQIGASVAGIASVEDINRYAPEGHRPTDLLPGAKSVVAVGGPRLKAAAWRTPSSIAVGLETQAKDAVPIVLSNKMAEFIEERYGYCAIPTVPNRMYGGFDPVASIKLFAEMAGLGTRSLMGGVVLNPEYGCLYYSGVITTLPLKADGPLRKPVCPSPECVKTWNLRKTTPCIQACPECISGELEDGRIKWMKFNRECCYPRASPTPIDFQKMLLEIVNERDPERRKMMVLGSYFSRVVMAMTLGDNIFGQCIECIRACPIGRSYRILR